ncbi:MAG: hemerythrin family protein [Chromatiaceae bacterium]|nr:hemerythrin family protein [Chromatiaceae bacterium]
MKELVWDKTLSVGVPEIDEDHRKLVDLFNLLNRSVAEGASRDYTEALVDELISCTVWHFKHEERLMLKYGYPGLAEHRSEHTELIDSAQALQWKFQSGESPASSEDIEFVEHWLTGHIYGADMDLGAYLGEVM